MAKHLTWAFTRLDQARQYYPARSGGALSPKCLVRAKSAGKFKGSGSNNYGSHCLRATGIRPCGWKLKFHTRTWKQIRWRVRLLRTPARHTIDLNVSTKDRNSVASESQTNGIALRQVYRGYKKSPRQPKSN